MKYRNTDDHAVATRRNDPFTSLIDSFFSNTMPELFEADLIPATNISETDQAFLVALEMPGLKQEDIAVQMQDGHLVVTAERRDERQEEGRTWHRIEQRFGKMSRTIALPKGVKADSIGAAYKNGILTLTVPKAPEAKPTRIEIKGD
jgi:HSP20 family protein